MSSIRFAKPARISAGVVGAAVIVVGGASVAGAHVNVSPERAEAGSYAILTFSVPHGCELSSTTEVAIDIPEQVMAVTPTAHPSWDVAQLTADGSPAEGAPATRVVYTAREPLPSDLRDAFELSVRMPDEAGETLAFPVVQTCEEGTAEWVELADEGQDPHDLEYPAPLVEVLEPATDTADIGGSDTAVSVAGVGVGAAGLVVAGVALLRTRRR